MGSIPTPGTRKVLRYRPLQPSIYSTISFHVYILYAPLHDRYYIGQTGDLTKRVARHQKGYVRSTRSYRPLALVYSEVFETRSLSVRRENELKGWKSKVRISELVDRSR